MIASIDLSEIAQNGISRIIAEHKAGQGQTNRHFWLSVFFVVLGMLATIGTNVLLQRRTEEIANKPAPAVVRLVIDKPAVTPILCPGDTLQYSIAIEIDAPNVGDSVVVVKNLDTHRTEISERSPRIDEEPGLITVQTNWTLPRMLPATSTRPERPWTAGRHRRIIAVTSDEGDKDAEPASIDFIISSYCPGVKLG